MKLILSLCLLFIQWQLPPTNSKKFHVMNSPFQRYLNEGNDVMTSDQKRGFFIFMGSRKCINCHNIGDLGDSTFFASK